VDLATVRRSIARSAQEVVVVKKLLLLVVLIAVGALIAKKVRDS
jgi:hypothetical protein